MGLFNKDNYMTLLEKVAAAITPAEYRKIKRNSDSPSLQRKMEAGQARRKVRANRMDTSVNSVAKRVESSKRDIIAGNRAKGEHVAKRLSEGRKSLKTDMRNPSLNKKSIVERARAAGGRPDAKALHKGKVGAKYIHKVDRAVGKTAKRGLKGLALAGVATGAAYGAKKLVDRVRGMDKKAFSLLKAHDSHPGGDTAASRIAYATAQDAKMGGVGTSILGGVIGAVVPGTPLERARRALIGAGAGAGIGSTIGAARGALSQGSLEAIEGATGLKVGSTYWDGNEWTN